LSRAFVDRMYDNYDRGTRRAVLRLYRATEIGQSAHRLAEVLRPLALPALVLWGKHDPYVPYRYAEEQRAVFPGARVIVLERSGHWPFVDDLPGVVAELVPFLRDQLRSAAPQAAR